MQESKNAGIAIQAAWELVRRKTPSTAPERYQPPKIHQTSIARFLGFVEGRLQVSNPPNWEFLITHARAERERIIGSEIGEFGETGNISLLVNEQRAFFNRYEIRSEESERLRVCVPKASKIRLVKGKRLAVEGEQQFSAGP